MATYRGQAIDLTPSNAMANEAERALAWRKEGHKGGTAVGVARAVQLKNKTELSPSTVRRMHSFFSRHEVDKKATGFSPGEAGYPSPGRVAWAMWGGDAGQRWARSKVATLDRLDGKTSSKSDEEGSLTDGACPLPLVDKAVNKENHLFVAKVAFLGPADPRQPNDEYWSSMAQRWECTTDEARRRLCSNCAHYFVNKHIAKCMQTHDQLTPQEVDPAWVDMKDGEGFCDLYDISCSRSRTCVDWAMGGPVRDEGSPIEKSEKSAGAHIQRQVVIKRYDNEKQIVYGEVYAPYVLDTYGEFMTPEDIELMAHRFMKLDLNQVIDTQHDNVPNGSYPIESFIAREGDPHYTPGAWVLGVKVPDAVMWHRVKMGELNGFSFQSMVKPKDVDVVFEVVRDHVGKTEKRDDGHQHTYFVQVNEMGLVIGGTTDVVNGHSHVIRRASVTEDADLHTHRFFL